MSFSISLSGTLCGGGPRIASRSRDEAARARSVTAAFGVQPGGVGGGGVDQNAVPTLQLQRLVLARGTEENIGRTQIGLVALLLWFGLVEETRAADPNTLSAGEKAGGWQLLFDGQTTRGWRGYKSQSMPESWRVEDGSLLARREPGKSSGDIITTRQFANLELLVDWKMTAGNNSGVIYRATEEHDEVSQSGPEFQILDNQGHVDGLNPLASAGACYAMYAVTRRQFIAGALAGASLLRQVRPSPLAF